MLLVFNTKNSEPEELDCVICRTNNPVGQLAAASLYADGRQAVACSKHQPHNTRSWVMAWIDFETQEHAGRNRV